jgi:hypothetical protein
MRPAARRGANLPQAFRESRNAVREFPASGQSFWTQTNGPEGGDGIALASNSIGHVFVGTQGGGVFRSTGNRENKARFKETCSRLKRQRRYLKVKHGAAPQEFKSPCKQALKARFNWR